MEITLVTENSKIRYVGDGSKVEFNYDFNPIDISYVKVYKNLIEVKSPDVTIEPGVVTFGVAPLAGESVVIVREMPLTYERGIVSKGVINSDSLDNLAVELLGQIQQVNEKVSRVPMYPIDTPLTGEEIFNEFNQNVQAVKDAKEEVEGKVEEVNNAVSSGLANIEQVTSESQTAITENKNNAISEIESTASGLISQAEDAADRAEGYAQDAASSASMANIENKLTNCITIIPENIKYELSSDGIFTVKADSKIYKADGTFTTANVDLEANIEGVPDGTYFLIRTGEDNFLSRCLIDNVHTESTAPSSPTLAQLWYNKDTKQIKRYSGTSWVDSSLPISIITITEGKVTSVDKIFNGQGFIGNSHFVIEGTEGRASIGRNKDGSLNNSKWTANGLKISTFSIPDYSGPAILYFNGEYTIFQAIDYYDPNLNIMKEPTYRGFTQIGNCYIEKGIITSFNPKTVFHATDYNDFAKEVSSINSQLDTIGVYIYSSAQTYKMYDIVIATIDNETAMYKSLINNNIGNKLSDETKWEKLSLGGDSGHIGQIGYTVRIDLPKGTAWCDGGKYTKAQFPDVYQMLIEGKIQSTTITDFDNKVNTNGSCGFFGLDTSNESFKVPLLKDVYIKAGQAPTAFGAESLPNITGEIGHTNNYGFVTSDTYKTGAFKIGKNLNGSLGGSAGVQKYAIAFDASLSDPRYKDGAKVNPDHVVYRAYIVLYTSTAEVSEAQAAEFINGLALKADKSSFQVVSTLPSSPISDVFYFVTSA